LEAPGEDPIVFDLGTGLRLFGDTQPADGSFHATALVTHLHWDHVQGLPFLVPVNRPGATLDVYGPAHDGEGLQSVFERFMCPPYFPIRVADLLGHVRFHDCTDDDLSIGSAKVKVRPVPHVGDTNGYRVEWNGVTVAYISDHQQPLKGHGVADEVLELCDGADLLIHDAQYTSLEFAAKSTWGHCTVDYALHVAKEAGARRLALFHHDPSHSDDMLDDLGACVRAFGDRLGIEVLTAAEGLTVSFDGRRGAS
jgi:phosphoribosyl 1,2-cyclic phosphodiesterase